MDSAIVKKQLENKLFDAWKEMGLRARSGKVSDTQRMFGVVLGIRIALMQFNIATGQNAYAFAGSNGVECLIRSGFGQMTGKQLKEFGFPEL